MMSQKFVEEMKGGFGGTASKVAIMFYNAAITETTNVIGQGVVSFVGLKDVKVFDDEEKAKEWLVS